MHNLMKNLFDFLRSFTQFMRIFLVFLIIMMLFYWVQNIIGATWNWLNFAKPILNGFLTIGALFSNESLQLVNAVIEYKYFAAILLMVVLFFSCNLLEILWDNLENVYSDSRRSFKQKKEKEFNATLQKANDQEQELIKKYDVYISTSIKKRFSYSECKIDLDEQNKIMNKFLMEKTGVIPEKFQEGFLYSFSSFSRIDETLNYLFKVIKSEAPLDYIVCIQAKTRNTESNKNNLEELISLKFVNKIVMMAETSWRYEYNKIKRYSTSQLGVFQKGDKTFEIHQFLEK